MLIIHSFRDLSASASSIAAKYKVSDTYVLDTFDRYVKMDRLPLSDIISVDEVCLDLDPNCRYALVIQDFYTGNPIDLLSSRITNDTEPYFMSIPPSQEVYLFQKYRYLILANQSSITYHTDLRMNTRLRCMMNTYDYDDSLFIIDLNLRELRDLKELYIQFNTRNSRNPMDARIELTFPLEL